MSLIISEASIKTILEKGHINIPTVIQGHAWECLWPTNSLLEHGASVKTRETLKLALTAVFWVCRHQAPNCLAAQSPPQQALQLRLLRSLEICALICLPKKAARAEQVHKQQLLKKGAPTRTLSLIVQDMSLVV